MALRNIPTAPQSRRNRWQPKKVQQEKTVEWPESAEYQIVDCFRLNL